MTDFSWRRAGLLGLTLVCLGLYWLGGYAGTEISTPHPQPWWEVTLVAPTPTVQAPRSEEPTTAPRWMMAAPPRLAVASIPGPGGPVQVAAGEALFRLTGPWESVQADLLRAGAVWAGIGEGSAVGRVAFGADVALSDVRAALVGVAGIADVRANPVVRAAAKGGRKAASTSSASSTSSPTPAPPPPSLCGPGDLTSFQWERLHLGSPSGCNQESLAPPVVVALLDTGVAYEDWTDSSGTYLVAPELDGVPFVDPYDFINLDTHANDDHQHGTHLAGLIASRDRLRGHAANPVLMPIKVLDDQMVGTEWSLVEGIHWAADHGAEIINLSLTFPAGYMPSGDLLDAVMDAHLAGAVIVGAAGNEAASVAYPAALTGVIAVGSYSGAGMQPTRALYSNVGSALDVMGPGGALDLDENWDGVPDGMLAQTIVPGDPTSFAYWSIAGTSQATAIVSAQMTQLIAESLGQRSGRDGLLLAARTLDDRQWGVPTEGGGMVSADGFGTGRSEMDVPPTFVNVVQGIVAASPTERRLEVVVQVVDGDGAPVPWAVVHGHVSGSVNGDVNGETDTEGRVTLQGPTVVAAAGDPLVFLFQVDAVEVDEEEVWTRLGLTPPYAFSKRHMFYPVEPGGFYGLDEGSKELVSGVMAPDPTVPLLFRVDAADAVPEPSQPGDPDPEDVCDLFDCSTLEESFMVRSLGSGLSASTVNVSFNWSYLASIAGSGLSASTVNVSFSQSFWFPWGSAASQPMEVFDLTGSGLSASTVNVLRWNPYSFSTAGSGLSASTVNVLSYDPRTYGVGHAAPEVYFVTQKSQTWGSGLSASTVNALDLFGPSSGFGLSAWGSLLGSGLSASTVNAFYWPRVMLPIGSSTSTQGSAAPAPPSSAVGAWMTPL